MPDSSIRLPYGIVIKRDSRVCTHITSELRAEFVNPSKDFDLHGEPAAHAMESRSSRSSLRGLTSVHPLQAPLFPRLRKPLRSTWFASKTDEPLRDIEGLTLRQAFALSRHRLDRSRQRSVVASPCVSRQVRTKGCREAALAAPARVGYPRTCLSRREA